MKLNAFIPAAGFGTRLQPITNYIPKPLLPVLGCPIIEHVLDKVFDLPVEKIGVNLHHHGDQILINTEEFEKTNLTSVDMFVIQTNVPYPVMVPSFPKVTTHDKLDFGSKM